MFTAQVRIQIGFQEKLNLTLFETLKEFEVPSSIANCTLVRACVVELINKSLISISYEIGYLGGKGLYITQFQSTLRVPKKR